MNNNDDDQRVTDGGDFHKYYTALPNLLDDFTFKSGWTHRVYAHLKRVTGSAPGEPFKRSTRQIAKHLGCSVGAVSNAKAALAEGGLIVIEKYDTPTGEGDLIHLLDIWPENAMVYSETNKRKEKRRPLAERVAEAKASIKARAIEWQAELDAARLAFLIAEGRIVVVEEQENERSNSERSNDEGERSNSERSNDGGSVHILNAGDQIMNAEAALSVHILNDSEEQVQEKNHEKNHDQNPRASPRGSGDSSLASKKKNGDPNQQHAACVAFYELTGRRPGKLQAEEIANAITQVDVWRSVVKRWHLESFGRGNDILGMIGLYNREIAGGPPNGQRNGNGTGAATGIPYASNRNGRPPVPKGNGLAGGAMPDGTVEAERLARQRRKALAAAAKSEAGE